MKPERYEEVSLKSLILKATDWYKFFLSKWKILLVAGVAGASIGLTLALLATPSYTAKLTFANEEKGGGNPYAGLASQFGFDLGSGGGVFTGDNIMELLKSRLLIEKSLLTAVRIGDSEELLVNRFIDFNEFGKIWEAEENPELKGMRFAANAPRDSYSISKDSVLNAIHELVKENLEVEKPDKTLSIISVTFKSEDEIFAKIFVEVLVRNVSEFYIATKTGKSKANIAILQSRLDSVKTALDRELYGAALTKDQNMNAVRAQSGVQLGKKQMNVSILTSAYGELIKNLEASKLMLMREEPLIQIIDRPILPLEREKLGKKKGILIGGIAGGGILMCLLFVRRRYSQIMNQPD